MSPTSPEPNSTCSNTGHHRIFPRSDCNIPSASSVPSSRIESLATPPQTRRRPPLHARQSFLDTTANLRLPSLPRFHPANFALSQSSGAAVPQATGPNSSRPPLSPRSRQMQYAEVQRQIYLYEHLPFANKRNQTRGPAAEPTSPRLIPLESPGPVTPMELEGADSYLTANANANNASYHADKLIREDALRRDGISPGRTAPADDR